MRGCIGMKKDFLPSETEWQLMEVLWESGSSLSSLEIIHRINQKRKMSPRTARVLLNRLKQKGMVDFTIDEKDSRIYYYFPKRTREECRQEKSRQFAESYFAGSQTGVLVSLAESFDLSEKQIDALRKVLDGESE